MGDRRVERPGAGGDSSPRESHSAEQRREGAGDDWGRRLVPGRDPVDPGAVAVKAALISDRARSTWSEATSS